MPNVAQIAAAAALLFAVAPMPAFAAETTTGSCLAVRFSNGHGSREESTLDIDSKAFGLTPEQFAGTNGTVTLALEITGPERVRSHGFAHPTIEQLVKLKALNIVDASWTPVLV